MIKADRFLKGGYSMKCIDLHVHSSSSDGTLSPRELVLYAKEKNLAAFALTDHDVVDGIEEALAEGQKQGIEIVPGIELAAQYQDREIHILGFFIDYKDPYFLERLQWIQKERKRRNQKMLEKLNDLGFDITLEELKSVAGKDLISRAHFGKLLQEKGYAASITDAFQLYLSPGKAAYVQREVYSPKECIHFIHEAKGLAVLAHPTLYDLSDEEIKDLIKILKAEGLDGIEAIYSLYTNEEEAKLRSWAHHYNLFITGGSDFHGKNKRQIDLGTGRGNLKIPYELLEEMKKRLKK
jgi:predicted metal-dependent phosphoesterase TrpH